MSEIIMRQARLSDIAEIERMYQAVVAYQDAHNVHQWYADEVTWQALSETYVIEDYYVGVKNGQIVCGLFIVDVDLLYWPAQPKGASLYLHKICVHPDHRGAGYADIMLSFFKAQGQKRGMNCVRLDVREKKKPLRQMYERNGFQLVTTGQFVKEFTTALYVYNL